MPVAGALCYLVIGSNTLTPDPEPEPITPSTPTVPDYVGETVRATITVGEAAKWYSVFLQGGTPEAIGAATGDLQVDDDATHLIERLWWLSGAQLDFRINSRSFDVGVWHSAGESTLYVHIGTNAGLVSIPFTSFRSAGSVFLNLTATAAQATTLDTVVSGDLVDIVIATNTLTPEPIVPTLSARDPLTVAIDWDDSGTFETVPRTDLLAVNVFYGCDTVSDVERASLASAFGSLVISNLDRKYTPGVSTAYTVPQLTARHLCRVTQGAETVWEGYLQAPEFIIDRFVDEVSWELVGKVKGNLPSGDATTYRVRLPNVGIDNQVSDLIDAWFVKFSDVTRQTALLTDFSIGAVAWDNNALEFINECAAFEGGYAYETLDGGLAVLSEARLAGDTPQYVSPATITIIHPAVEKPDIGRLYNRAIITSTQAVKESEETLLSLGGFRVPASGNLTDTYFVAEDFENPLYTIDWTTPIVLDNDTLIQHRANATDSYDVNTRVTGGLTVTIDASSTSENRVRLVITNTATFEKYIELLLVSGRPTRNLADVSQRTYSDSVPALQPMVSVS